MAKRPRKLPRTAEVGRFVLPDGFPDEYYAFTDGELSATVEKHGGINTLTLLDVLEHNGKRYPDRAPTPAVFLREGNRCGKRPLYGPAVQFISTTRRADGSPGRNLFHTPDHVELYPFGFRSTSSRFGHNTSYDMAIIGRDVLFAFTNQHPVRDALVISINKDHIVQGEMDTLKNQVTNVALGDQGDQPELDPAVPFAERRPYVHTWTTLGFDPDSRGFVMDGTMAFVYGDKRVFVLLTADRPMQCRETPCRYLLTVPWDDARRIRACLVVAESCDEALARSRRVLDGLDSLFTAKVAESVAYSNAAPRLSAEHHDAVKPFATTAPSFLRSMVLAETDTEACIRAAVHKFGYFIGWDQLWPAKALLLMGDTALAEKLVRYHITLTGTEQLTMAVPLIINLVEDVTAHTGNTDFLKSVYPHVRTLFRTQHARTSPNGMVTTSNTFGVDDPGEIGITGDVWGSDVNGWWYAACRAMANLALFVDDAETQQSAGAVAATLQQTYLPTFYDESTGYLFCAVDAQTAKGVPFFQNVSTIVMDTPYGEALLHPQLDAIARFQAEQLYHPAGRSAVAYWDSAHEMWKNCIMYQHIVHEMRLSRAAGLGDEINRMMDVYLDHFERNKTALETHNLVGAEGDITQRANWQAFGARALYSAIVEALMGIQVDLGGFGYVPCDMTGRMALANWRFRDGRWDVTIRGTGPYVRRLVVDGTERRGTLKVPAEYYTDDSRHSLLVERGRRPLKRPTLLSAPGAAVNDVTSEGRSLSFGVAHRVHTTCKIFSPAQPRVTVAGNDVPVDWDAGKQIAWADVVVEPGVRVEVSCV